MPKFLAIPPLRNFSLSFLVVAALTSLMLLCLNACGGESKFTRYLDLALSPGVDFDSIQTARKVVDRSAHTHRNGYHWHLYAVNAPMTWRITRGRPDLVIAAVDIWRDSLPSHPDLHVYDGKAGNLVVSNGSDSSLSSYTLRGGHGLTVLGMAVAEGNLNKNGGPMVGISPECRGMAIRREQDVWKVDADMLDNGRRLLPAVCNVSLVDNDRENFEQIVNSGIVLVSAAGNSRSLPQFATTIDTNIVVDSKSEEVKLRFPRILFPAAFNFVDANEPNNPNSDVKVIAVAGVRDGNVACSDSSVCGGDYFGCRYNDGWTWRGPLQFVDNWNFSTATDKFNSHPDPDVRIPARERAFVDLVAPANPLMSLSADSATYGFSSGTSQAAPLVAGTVGLMLSIDRTLGLGGKFDSDGMYSRGAALHRRAYDILTFTASKLPDSENIFYSFKPNYGYFTKDRRGRKVFMALDNIDGSPIQYDYVTQARDPLRRSWAQRVGFGMLDVYRAVAHAIPNKAQAQYLAGETLNFDAVKAGANGVRLMHMGAWRPAESLNSLGGTHKFVAVLDSGGVSLPGQKHNNQGLTILHEGVQLEVVGQNQILAIDGIVRSAAGRAKQEEIASRNGAAIMAAGRTEGVKLQGQLSLGNLTAATHFNGSDSLISDLLILESETSELHGKLELENGASCLVNNGTSTMHPGSQINLNGFGKLRIGAGATLDMRYGSQVKAKSLPAYLYTANGKPKILNKTIVERDANIRCSGMVNLHSYVELLPGAELHVLTACLLSVDSIYVHAGARIIIHPEAHLAIRQSIVCEGEIVSVGQQNQVRSSISGRFPEIEIDIDKVRCEDVIAPANIELRGTAASASLTLQNIQIDGVYIWYSGTSEISISEAQINMPREFSRKRGAVIMANIIENASSTVNLRNTTFTVSGQAGLETSSLQTAVYMRPQDKYLAEGVRIEGLQREFIKTDRPYINRDLIFD